MRRMFLAVLAGSWIVTGPLHAEPSSPLLQPDQVIVNSQALGVIPVRWHRHWHRHRRFHRLVLLPFAPPPQLDTAGQGSSGGADVQWVDPDERAQ